MTTDRLTATLEDARTIRWQARGLTGRTATHPDEDADAPTPGETVLAALCASLGGAIARGAARRSIPLDALELEATLQHDEQGEIEGVDVRISLRSPADEAAIAKLVDLAQQNSPIAELLHYEPDIVLVHHRV